MSAAIKLCGLRRLEDIEAVNELKPDYIGFVFWPKSKRYITREQAGILKNALDKDIKAVGVFIDEDINIVSELLNDGIIDIAQLHGSEDNEYIKELRLATGKEIIKAFKVTGDEVIKEAEKSEADHILLDSGAGTGMVFNWEYIKGINRPYFLAGGLDPFNVSEAVKVLDPFALDVSSGIETDGFKDVDKMKRFIENAKAV